MSYTRDPFSKSIKSMDFIRNDNSCLTYQGVVCEIVYEDGAKILYTLHFVMGEGGFGEVGYYIPKEKYNDYAAIAIKKFIPKTKFAKDVLIEEIEKRVINKLQSTCDHETFYNKKILGNAFSFILPKPFIVSRGIKNQKVVSYPEYYMAMPCAQGETLDNVCLHSSQQFFEIIHAIAINLKKFHSASIVHGDIKSNNVVVEQEPYKATFIDMTFTRSIGQAIKVKGMNLGIKPPEFRGLVDTDVDFNQDIHSLGRMFEELVRKVKLSLLIKKEVDILITKMCNILPFARPDIYFICDAIACLKEKNAFIEDLLQKLKACAKHFPNPYSINQWCYYFVLIQNISKAANLLEVQAQIRKVHSSDSFLAFESLEKAMLNRDYKNLSVISFYFEKTKHMMQFLHYLHQIKPEMLISIFNKKQKIKKMMEVLPKHEVEFLTLLATSYIQKKNKKSHEKPQYAHVIEAKIVRVQFLMAQLKKNKSSKAFLTDFKNLIKESDKATLVYSTSVTNAATFFGASASQSRTSSQTNLLELEIPKLG